MANIISSRSGDVSLGSSSMVYIVAVSDVHYEKKTFKGVDETRAWKWLVGIVGYHKPDLLLSAGDLGTAVNLWKLKELVSRVMFLAVYGNHDNLTILSRVRNTDTGLPVLMDDGVVYEVGGVRIAGVNGIVSQRRRMKGGVPRKTPEEFLAVARRLQGERVDILLLHQTPYLPELFNMKRDPGGEAALEAVRLVKPRIVVNGHMHQGGFNVYRFPWGTLFLNIDSSREHRHYLVIHAGNGMFRVEVWRDMERVKTIRV